MTSLLWCVAMTVLDNCCGCRESGQWLWPYCCGVLQWQCCPIVVVAESSQWLWPHCCGVLQWQCCPTVVVAERADLNEVTDNRDFTVMSCWDPPSQWVHNCPFSPSGSQCLYPLLYIYIYNYFFFSHPNSYFLALYIDIRKKFLFFFLTQTHTSLLIELHMVASSLYTLSTEPTDRTNKTPHTHTHALSLAHPHTHTHIHSHSLKNSRLSRVCIPVSH